MTGVDANPANPGGWILRVAMVSTIIFGVVQIVADIFPRGPVLAVAVLVSLVMFFAGSATFLVGFVVAAGRSRDDQVTMSGLFWLTDVAPPFPAKVLRGALIVQVVLAFATAAVRPFTALAFGILAPVAGLGMLVLWAARHAVFVPIGHTESAANDIVEPTSRVPAIDEDPDDFDQLFRGRRRPRR